MTATLLNHHSSSPAKRPSNPAKILVAQGAISENDLAESLARAFHLPFVDLASFPVNQQALALVPAGVILKHHVLPIDLREGTLFLAAGDPLAFDAVDAVRLNFRHAIKEVVAVPSQIEARIAALFHPDLATPAVPGGIDAILHEFSETELREVSADASEQAPVTEQHGTVIHLVNQILVDAYQRGASDIHIEPNGAHETVVVRLRVDGDCFVHHRLPAPLAPPVVARLKIMADLDIAERRKPQDGKVRFKVGNTPLELRVATLPTVGGNEDIVLRLLPPSKPRPLVLAFEGHNMGTSAA